MEDAESDTFRGRIGTAVIPWAREKWLSGDVPDAQWKV
jgi:hypothetical protein